jgi:hypothetical protein
VARALIALLGRCSGASPVQCIGEDECMGMLPANPRDAARGVAHRCCRSGVVVLRCCRRHTHAVRAYKSETTQMGKHAVVDAHRLAPVLILIFLGGAILPDELFGLTGPRPFRYRDAGWSIASAQGSGQPARGGDRETEPTSIAAIPPRARPRKKKNTGAIH